MKDAKEEAVQKDSRLSVALHVLVHLHEAEDGITSEQLGKAMGLHPVVLRRTLGGLRDAGVVRARKGRGGGWALARSLDAVTIADVYQALGSPPAFGLAVRDPEPGCVIEREVNRTVGQALEEAEVYLLARFAEVTLADLARARRQALTHPHHAHSRGVKHA